MSEQESDLRTLSCSHRDKLALLRRIGVNDPVAVRVIKDESDIRVVESLFSPELDVDAQVATGIGDLEFLTVSIERLDLY